MNDPFRELDDFIRTCEIMIVVCGVVGVIILAVLLSGCDRFINTREDDRRLQMDCTMEAADGTIMHCSQDLEKNIDTGDDSISIKNPAGR